MRALRGTASTCVLSSVTRTQAFSASPAVLPSDDVAIDRQHAFDHARRLREMSEITALASKSLDKPSIQEGHQQQRLPSLAEVSKLLKPGSSTSCASSSSAPQLEVQADWRDLLAALQAHEAQVSKQDVLTDTFGCVFRCM